MGRAARVQSIGKATTRPRLSAAVAPQSQRNLPVALAARGHCRPSRKPHGLGARKSFIVRRRREARYIICDECGRVCPAVRRRMRGRHHGRPRLLRRLLALAVKTRRRRTPLVRRGLMLPEGRAYTVRCQLPRSAFCAACSGSVCMPAAGSVGRQVPSAARMLTHVTHVRHEPQNGPRCVSVTEQLEKIVDQTALVPDRALARCSVPIGGARSS